MDTQRHWLADPRLPRLQRVPRANHRSAALRFRAEARRAMSEHEFRIDPELEVFYDINAELRDEMVQDQVDPWEASPFAWIRRANSRRRGAIGEALMRRWAREMGILVQDPVTSGHDCRFDGVPVEVKTSLLWEGGWLSFQQLRDQDYEVACLLGIEPLQIQLWAVPKGVLWAHAIGQHGGLWRGRMRPSGVSRFPSSRRASSWLASLWRSLRQAWLLRAGPRSVPNHRDMSLLGIQAASARSPIGVHTHPRARDKEAAGAPASRPYPTHVRRCCCLLRRLGPLRARARGRGRRRSSSRKFSKGNGMNDNGSASIDAVKALRARGIGNAEDLLEYGTPDQILGACHRWDQRKNVGPGVLAAMIRNGEFVDEQPARPAAPTSASRLRARFDEYVARFPEGSVAEPHRPPPGAPVAPG